MKTKGNGNMGPEMSRHVRIARIKRETPVTIVPRVAKNLDVGMNTSKAYAHDILLSPAK
jgi:hypothetical protein